MMLRRSQRGRAGGFTLVEVLLAVGALALLSVALAAALAGIGRTVSAGRRISLFQTYANAIERRLRADIESMTRDGVLIIRNEYARSDAPVPERIELYPGDPNPRPRRTDEMVFFRPGPITTARPPLHPRFVARGEAARIYYGHGRRVPEDLNPNGVYRLPEPDDTNDALPGLGTSASDPNRYAADWLLLRHATVLAQPSGTLPAEPPDIGAFGLTPAQLRDSDVQVALQPAASGLFRVLAGVFPDGPTLGADPIRDADHPLFTSGIVDIATTDLAEVRSIVMCMQDASGTPILPQDINDADDFEQADLRWFPRMNPDTSTGQEQLSGVHAWMLELLPAWSHAVNADDRVRIRAEPAPTDFFGALDMSSLTQLESNYRQADQIMLSSSVFVPRCTEFIVEWSFGKTYPPDYPDPDLRNELIWHGLLRTDQPENAGGTGLGQDARLLAEPYRPDLNADLQLNMPYRLATPDPATGSPYGGYPVRMELIHGVDPDADIDTGQLFSFFGYVDPTFDPDDPLPAVAGDASEQPVLPWAWPKLIRVTLSLVDPTDPTIEETFQFVFETPGNPEP